MADVKIKVMPMFDRDLIQIDGVTIPYTFLEDHLIYNHTRHDDIITFIHKNADLVIGNWYRTQLGMKPKW